MGDGAVAGNIVQDINAECLPRPVGAGGDCYHWQYMPAQMLWYGVYWQYPANNWGDEEGREVSFWVPDPSLGPTAIRMRYNRVRFYAAATREAGVPLAVEFYAGQINDPTFTIPHCSDPTQRCKHRDSVSSSSQRTQMLTTALQPFSLRLFVPPPCVTSSVGDEPQFGDNGCPEGTVRARSDGKLEVATCGSRQASGQLQIDGSITCCTESISNGMCPAGATSFAGSWQALDEIYDTVIGGFGWALNYAEYEERLALQVANGTLPAGSTVDPVALPPTHLYVDDVVWDYVAQ
jgi:hypothetical protein